MDHDPRDLEWQRRYEAHDTPWDKGRAAPPLTDYLHGHGLVGRVLVPGCGRGHDVRAIAAQPAANVVGLDLSGAALEDARKLTPEPAAGITYLRGDFFQLPATLLDSFDWIVEHTCFCAIEPRERRAYVNACANALREQGRIFAIFYLDPDTEAGPPFRVSRDELDELFGPFFSLQDEWVPSRSFEGRQNRELVRVLQKRAV